MTEPKTDKAFYRINFHHLGTSEMEVLCLHCSKGVAFRHRTFGDGLEQEVMQEGVMLSA